MKRKQIDCSCRRSKRRVILHNRFNRKRKLTCKPIRRKCVVILNSLQNNGIKPSPSDTAYYREKSAEFQIPPDNEIDEQTANEMILEQQSIIDADSSVNYSNQAQYASLPRITIEDYIIARTQIPEFKINWCDYRFRFLGYRIVVSYPCIQTQKATFEIYARITYPTIMNNNDIRQIVNSCAQSAKDDAIERLLLLLPFATVSFGSSVVAAFQQAFTTFQSSFISCLRTTAEGLKPSVRGPYWRSRDRSGWRNLF